MFLRKLMLPCIEGAEGAVNKSQRVAGDYHIYIGEVKYIFLLYNFV